GLGAGGGNDIDVIAGIQCQAVAGANAAAVVDVVVGVELDICALQGTAQVVDVLGRDRGDLAGDQLAAVVEVAGHFQPDIVGGHQAALGVDAVFAHHHIDPRHQYVGDGAVGQGALFFHQPHDV